MKNKGNINHDDFISAKSLLSIYINEVIGAQNGQFVNVKNETRLYYMINRQKVYLTNPMIAPNKLIKGFDNVLIEKKNDSNLLLTSDILSLLQLSKQGKTWFKKNVEVLVKKKLVDHKNPQLSWNEILERVENHVINRSYFLAIIEQYNPAYERFYHPLPHLHDGQHDYIAYFAKYVFPKKQNPLIGSYPLFSFQLTEEPEVILSTNGMSHYVLPKVMYVHPENVHHINDEVKDRLRQERKEFVPFSSIRTGFFSDREEIVDEKTKIIKLDYLPKVTSRSRKIPKVEHHHAIQVNNLLKLLIDAEELKNIAFISDLYAVIDKKTSLSFRIRSSINDIYPTIPASNIVFPSFGFYYYNNVFRKPLICELIDRSNLSPHAFLKQNILRPVFNTFFSLAFLHGLVHESHGQNILISYNLERHCTDDVVLRDLESIVINEEFLLKYYGIIDKTLEDVNKTDMKLFIASKEMKEKVSKRFHHWVMQVHIEPILETIHTFYDVPIEELYSLTAQCITEWFVTHDKIDRMYDMLELKKHYLRNYLYTNKMFNLSVGKYREYDKPLYAPTE